jgi:hypothetical protein
MNIHRVFPVENGCGKPCGECGKVRVFHSLARVSKPPEVQKCGYKSVYFGFGEK